MSNAGQAVLTVVGTVVGAYFGYPQLGFALGSLAGQALFPTKLPTVSGPKLADFGQTQSSVGAAIPQGWGTCPATGNIIAKTDVREVIQSDEVGGKGGPTQTVETPTYFQDFAIGFNDGEIAGVRRLWSNGKLIYDRTPRRETELEAAFNERMAANDLLDEKMVVYFGTEDQEPDPTLEAFYGVGEVSAFRGLAYIVFIDWMNKPEDGNKMPLSWRIEFFTDATVTTTQGTQYANELLFPWVAGYPENSLNAHTYAIDGIGYGTGGVDPIEATPITSVAEGVAVMATFRSSPMDKYQGVEATPALLGGFRRGYLDSMGGSDATEFDYQTVVVHYNSFENSKEPYEVNGQNDPQPGGGVGVNYCTRLNRYLAFDEVTLTRDGYTGVGIFTDTGNKQYIKLVVGETAPQFWHSTATQCNGGDADEHMWLGENAGCCFSITKVPRPPDDPCAPFGGAPVKRLPGTNAFAIVNGQLTRCGAWTKVFATTHVMQAFAGGPPVTYPRNPCRPQGHAQYNDRTFWEEAYQENVALGLMPKGLVYGVHYPDTQAYYWKRDLNFDTYETHPVALGEILHDLCIQSGYQESDFNVSDLDDTLVLGFVRTGPMAARGCIEALRPIAMFDECEDSGVITFLKRGKGIVGTVQDEDLGAFYASEDGQDGKAPVSKITTTKTMDYDIPRQVRVHYLSYERDYDAGEAPSPVRTDTDAVQTVDFDTTCILTDEIAAQIAQRIWADFWASRWQHTIYLDASAQQYKATDCLAVPVDGQFQRMRIGSITDKLPSIRQFELVRDDSAAFISYAQGSAVPPSLTEVITVNSPCDVILLDLPPLRDQDDDAGVYAAAVPALAGSTFKGATLMRSVDGGNYDRVANFSSASVTGTVLVAPSTNADPQVIDRGSEMTILLPAGTLASRTLSEVLSGANAAAIGDDGRWEIIQWQDATLFGSTTWTISGLLRGRRGTEHNIGTTIVGDKFIVLAQAIRVPLDIALVNKEMQYKCVASGTTLESADAVAFTGHGVALKPFSPCRIKGDRDPETGLWTLEWLRRGRIGQTMQSGTDIALSEEVSDYEVEILDDDENPVRTLSVSAEAAEYLYTSQLVDFGFTPDTLRVNIYQMSTKVGRGYAGFATMYAKQPYVGPPGDAPFIAAGGDGDPVPAGYADSKFILCKRGTKGGIAQIGFYAWTGAGSPIFLGSNYYEEDNIPTGGVPGMYTDAVKTQFPYFAVPNVTTYGMYWSYQPFGAVSSQVAAGRHLYYTTVTGQAPQRVPITSSVIAGGSLQALYAYGGTWYAILEGDTGTSTAPKLYTSANGVTWALVGNVTGLGFLDYTGTFAQFITKIFRFDGITYAQVGSALYKNTANNLVAWTAVSIDEISGFSLGNYGSYTFRDVVVSAAAIVIVAEMTKASDGVTYNTLFTKGAGSPDQWNTTREVAKNSDTPSGFAYDLEWRVGTRLGVGGFAIYGVNPFSGAYGQVLTSPDGFSWTSSKVSFGAGLEQATVINAISSDTGGRIVATDNVPFIQGLADSGNTIRYSSSTDGINFTAVPAFP